MLGFVVNMLGFEWFEGRTLWRPVTCIRRIGG